jgi:hypothetical protein
MERVVVPALDAFKPQLLLVSAGFDANYQDPLAAMGLGSEDFRCIGILELCLDQCRFQVHRAGMVVPWPVERAGCCPGERSGTKWDALLSGPASLVPQVRNPRAGVVWVRCTSRLVRDGAWF